MKPHILFAFILVLCLGAFSKNASAQDGEVYFAGYVGLNIHDGMEFSESITGTSGNFDYDSATSFAGALGIRYESNLRLEAEISYRSAEGETITFDNNLGVATLGGEMQTFLGMLNAYYDFDLDLGITPFISGGIGFAWTDVNIDDTSGLAIDTANDDLGFAWQLGTGLRYQVSPDLSMSGGYRYLDTVDLEIGSYEIDYSSHEFRVGLEYALPAN